MVERLEKNGKGLNLTKEVRDGILCHTGGTEAMTLEGRIVRTADRIAYLNHDIDDAERAGVLSEEDIPASITSVLGHSKSKRIDTLVRSVVENSGENGIGMDPDPGGFRRAQRIHEPKRLSQPLRQGRGTEGPVFDWRSV